MYIFHPLGWQQSNTLRTAVRPLNITHRHTNEPNNLSYRSIHLFTRPHVMIDDLINGPRTMIYHTSLWKCVMRWKQCNPNTPSFYVSMKTKYSPGNDYLISSVIKASGMTNFLHTKGNCNVVLCGSKSDSQLLDLYFIIDDINKQEPILITRIIFHHSIINSSHQLWFVGLI